MHNKYIDRILVINLHLMNDGLSTPDQGLLTNCVVFHSAHPTGWAESLSGNGVCVYVWMYVITSKKTIISARRLHRPL